jgi:Glycosyl transferases group 1
LSIFGWAADQSGCGYYRLGLPLGHLRTLGHQVHLSVQMPPEAWDADVVIGQRVSLPGPAHVVWKRLAAQPRGKRPLLVYEIDDDLLNIDPTSHPMTIKYYGSRQIRDNIVMCAELADLVTVSTEPLAEVFRQYNPNTHVLPNCVPQWLLHHQPPRRDDGVITVGWQGSDTHNGDWHQAASQVGRYFRRTAQPLELHHMGGRCTGLPTLQPGQYRHTPWIEEIEAYYCVVDWHVALAPLADTTFNRSKSDIRVLEAASFGIPSVASDVDPYRRFIRHGENGYLCRSDHDWGRYLRILAEDPQQREKMGQAARDSAAERTVERNAHLWLDLYRQYL